VGPATPDTPGQHEYVLVLVDSFSHYVELIPTPSATAEHVVTALLDWFKRFGICHRWTSDRGTHFFNHIMTRLAQLLAAEHHFTAVYAAWSNGKVERVNKEIKAVMAAIMLSARIPDHGWPDVIRLVNYIINQSPTQSLGNNAPVTVFVGRPPSSPLSVVFDSTTAQLTTVPPSSAAINAAVLALHAELRSVHEDVKQQEQARKTRKRRGEQEVNFHPGDYVLVATVGASARNKTKPKWQGPAQVVAKVNERVFVVRDVGNGREREVHAEHLKFYHDADLIVTDDVRATAAHGGDGYNVEDIVGHGKKAGEWYLKILWEGGSITEEPFRAILEDVPALVRKYVHQQAEPVKEQLQKLLAAPARGSKRGAR
jgi:ribosomal protein L21E